ncbi:MAG: hydroxyacid dehydrogenase [bacterium]
MYRVLATDNLAPEAIEVFDAYDTIEVVSAAKLGASELAATIVDFDAVIVRSPTRLTADVIGRAARLKFIGRAGVGIDNIDVDAASAKGIIVMNAPGGNSISTAEHTVGMILAVTRRIAEADRMVRAQRWERKALRGVELKGKTLGVLGLGRVGREVARRMQGFSMDVIAVDPLVTRETASSYGARLVELDELIAASHVITAHVPLTAETRGMIGDREINRMRPGVFLINCARGGVYDEAAVRRGLDTGRVAGVAIDVYGTEPPGAHPLFSHERSVFTPHIGAATEEARIRVGVEIAEKIAKALTTGEIRDAVNRSSS